MSEPNVVSDNSIGAADTFSMGRCQEFISARVTDYETSYDRLTKQVVSTLPEAWTGAASARFAETLKRSVEDVKLDGNLLKKLGDQLKRAIERHGTATKAAEAIADAIEMPVWNEDII